MSEEFITNGDFETGDMAPWQVVEEAWFINDGSSELPVVGTVDPISGLYDLGGLVSYNVDWLVQVDELPVDIVSANISWSDRIISGSPFVRGVGYLPMPGFVPGQEVVVAIVDNLTLTVYDVFRTAPGDELYQYGPNDRSFDVTALAQSLEGRAVGLLFIISGVDGDLIFLVDDVSLNIYTDGDIYPVEIDIKPGSEPNCFNNDGHGVIPVAILGSQDFDVTTIDAGSVMLEGLAVKAVGKSNKLLAHYEDVNSDGYNDLVVQIEDDDLVFEEGETTATVTGNLNNGMPIQGFDTICIVP